MSQPAAVIDLEAFRQRRQPPAPPPHGSARPSSTAVWMLPVLVTWIPIWPVR
jgi:hypothetical protein